MSTKQGTPPAGGAQKPTKPIPLALQGGGGHGGAFAWGVLNRLGARSSVDLRKEFLQVTFTCSRVPNDRRTSHP